MATNGGGVEGASEVDGVSGLRRSLGVWAAGAFVVSNMVGTGIFTVPAFVRVATGSSLESLGVWAAGALLALCGALCYAELATRMPEAGGEYHFMARVYGPLWGFLSGWVSFLAGFSAAIAASSLAVVAYAAPLVPGWDPSAPLIGWAAITQGAGVAALLVVIVAVVHSLGVHTSGRVQTLLAATVLGAIALLVMSGVLTGRGAWRGLVASSEGMSSAWVALLQVSFAYSGWNAAAYLAGEVRSPRRNLPRALLGGTLAVAAAYLSLNVLFFYALPEAQWEAAIAIGQVAAERLFGPSGALLVSGLIALAIFGSVSANAAVGPRVYYAMARDGVAPAVLARVDPGTGAPRMAIVAQAVVSAALALTGAFEALLIYIGSALLLFAGLAVAAVIRVRWVEGAAGEGFRVPGYPLPPLIFLSMVVIAWAYGLWERPVPTGAALLMILAGALIYFIGRRFGWLRPTV